MTQTWDKAYLAQARSDFTIFHLLAGQDRSVAPECHALHYLQMTTEKLSKAAFLTLGVEGFDPYNHVAFSLVHHHLRRPYIALRLGYTSFDAYKSFTRSTRPIFREIDELNPAVGRSRLGGGSKEGPNVEYPWPATGSKKGQWEVPADHPFGLLHRLRSGNGAQVLAFVRLLIERFDSVFRRSSR